MKDILRKKFWSARKKLKGLKKTKKDHEIMKRLFRHPRFRKAKYIFIYLSLKDEVSTWDIVKKIAGKKHLMVPRVRGKHHLHLHEIQNFDHLGKGTFEIFEPKKECPEISPTKIELAMVPGIVFDKRGHRIGYGRGFMDRLFAKMKCPKIGLAYDFQMVEKIPEGPYDVPVDYVITEKKVYRCRL